MKICIEVSKSARTADPSCIARAEHRSAATEACIQVANKLESLYENKVVFTEFSIEFGDCQASTEDVTVIAKFADTLGKIGSHSMKFVMQPGCVPRLDGHLISEKMTEMHGLKKAVQHHIATTQGTVPPLQATG